MLNSPLPDPYEFRPLQPGVSIAAEDTRPVRREKAETLRVFPVLIAREACAEPLRVPIGVFEANPTDAYRKAYRIAKLFYGERFLKFV